ncbi:sensor histidine kinase [Micromonospora sp. MS34]|uniref:sensor histidine kinase n=1 Tax=Micromonospora sp. MS34 TaxID=3385971 RepID=UPI0039A094F8
MSRGRWSASAATAVWLASAASMVAQAGRGRLEVTPAVVYGLCVVPLVLGWLLVVRAPGSPVGPVLTWLAALMLATPAIDWGQWWAAAVWPWQLVGFMALLLVFPDGLPPGWWWRSAALAVPVAVVLFCAAFVVTTAAAHRISETVLILVMVTALAMLLTVVLACLAAPIVRYRRGGDRVRQQLRWLILAALATVTLMVASWIVTSLGWLGSEAYAGFLLGIIVLVPAALTVAVLRHDLFEIDRILGDSVAWLLTMAGAALAFAVLVTGLGYLLGRGSTIGLTTSVFGVALAVLPLHRRIHAAVARVVDRDRAVILDRVQRFVEQVRDGSAEPESVEAVLREAVGDPRLALLLTDVGRGGFVDLAGRPAEPVADGVRVPLRTTDAEIGELVVSPGSARAVRRARLAASAARLPIEVSRLRLGLRRAVHEVDDSRRRLITATVQERQRLERDLHDGAQQQLVALGMQLRSAQRRLPAGHPVAGELDQAVDRLEQTVAELRRLAHGVRPASLDDGLSAALTRLGADCPIPVDFDIHLDGVAVSEVVATTAYFVAAEAMTNVLKHASAARIRVSAQHTGEELRVAVRDDGTGGAPTDSGLAALRDRVGSIGGTLTVTSAPAAGTTVQAVLPCEW